MKKPLLSALVLALVIAAPVSARAGVDINIGISLPPPPPIAFSAQPELVVLPDTDDVYVIPEIEADLFFWNGWWWRPWQGRWYRSRYHDRAWAYYNDVPRFYFDVDPGWRGYYRDRNWRGHRWINQRIALRQLRDNWRSWHDNRYWEKKGAWGVQGYRNRPVKQERLELRQRREHEYRQRPEVQRHQQWTEQQRRPQVERGKDNRERRGDDGRQDGGRGRHND